MTGAMQTGLGQRHQSATHLQRQQQLPALRCRRQRCRAYTDADAATASRPWAPPVIDISNLLAGQLPTRQQILQVQQECWETGFLAVTGAVDEVQLRQLQQLFSTAQRFFDLPLAVKSEHVVGHMQRGRGFEVSPEHQAYMEGYKQLSSSSSSRGDGVEPSAADGILSERFMCGPPLSSSQLLDPYYSSELGQVFFAPDCPPSIHVAELQHALHQQYGLCERVADAMLRLFAVALGMPPDFFQDKIDRHHSNIQVANYPSQLLPAGDVLRKKAHVDSGTLTLLTSQDWLPGSSWQAGDGGLQLLMGGGQWVEVAVPSGALLLNLGSLMTRWTNGLWKSTLHRVTNPVRSPGRSRRLSLAFFHKPNYDAVIEPLPTCYGASAAAAAALGLPAGQLLPAGPVFPAAAAADLTRAGVLHKLRHLPREEASRLYHKVLAADRRAEKS